MMSIVKCKLREPPLVKITGSENITVSQPILAILRKHPVYIIIRPRTFFVASFAFPSLSRRLEMPNENMLVSDKETQ